MKHDGGHQAADRWSVSKMGRGTQVGPYLDLFWTLLETILNTIYIVLNFKKVFWPQVANQTT